MSVSITSSCHSVVVWARVFCRMQSAVGALLAFLSFVARDHIARRPPWDGGDADRCRSEAAAPSDPPAADEASCPAYWVHPGIVEEVAERFALDRCVCEVQCNGEFRDFAVFIGGAGFAFFLQHICMYRSLHFTCWG